MEKELEKILEWKFKKIKELEEELENSRLDYIKKDIALKIELVKNTNIGTVEINEITIIDPSERF